jgi:hypothetical protein
MKDETDLEKRIPHRPFGSLSELQTYRKEVELKKASNVFYHCRSIGANYIAVSFESAGRLCTHVLSWNRCIKLDYMSSELNTKGTGLGVPTRSIG